MDWSELERHEKPTGMTLLLYPSSSQTSVETIKHISANTHRANLKLSPGVYDIVVFNQSEIEFGTFNFFDLYDRDRARIEAERFTSRWYVSRSEDEITAHHPEWLALAEATGIIVSAEKTITSKQEDSEATGTMIAELTPENIVCEKTVRINIKNIYNLRSARGGVSGLAGGIILKGKIRLDTKATHLVEEWTMSIDNDNHANGYIESTFTCFGLPESHSGSPEDNVLTISFLLVDNKTVVDYSFHIGDCIHKGVAEETINIEFDDLGKPIVLPNVVPEGEYAGGFSSKVTPWDEVEADVYI
ncbi:MAG: DUF5119 domain-containing protein [Duncaniella sp.]|nr:DUF5119 domain-containing protein [Duncaniella sp.]